MALIESAISKNISTYDPERIQLTDDDTVEGRVSKLIQKNSPLMQSAITRANQVSNSRGLINSSLAAGETQRAVLDYATPIASQDASTSFQAKQLNQNAGNTANQFNVGQKNQFSLNEQGADLQKGIIGAQTDAQSRLLGEQSGYTKDINAQQADIQSRLMGEQAGYTKDINAQQQEFQLARDNILQGFQAAQNEIERQFQGQENAAQRELAREELLRNSATELMRQVSGQNATFMDAVGQINSADLKYADKTALIRSMTQMHLNNLQTTSAMSDFAIENGQVVYNSQSTTSGGEQNNSGGAANVYQPGTPQQQVSNSGGTNQNNGATYADSYYYDTTNPGVYYNYL